MFIINLDLSGLEGLKKLGEEIQQAADQAAKDMASMAHSKAVELASERLHTRRQLYIDALSVTMDQGVAVLTLDASATWIDDGMEPFDMKEGLLASPKAKTSKDGSRYVIVPFEHGPGKGATNTTPAQLDLVNTVKSEMKRRKIPWAKVEKDDQGRPKLGKLHRFDIDHTPTKTHEGPGQGRGPVGDVRQGPNMRQRVGGGPPGGGTPFLRGVAVYQHAQEGGGVKRSVMTFRIVSSKQQGEDIWNHPGLEPTRIFEDVEKWAQDEIEQKVLPALIRQLDERL